MEVGHGSDGGPGDRGGSAAGGDGTLVGDAARHRFANASSRLCRLPVPREPLGFGIGHVMDLGTPGSRPRIAWARGGTRGSGLGHRRAVGTAASLVPVVVMSESDRPQLRGAARQAAVGDRLAAGLNLLRTI